MSQVMRARSGWLTFAGIAALGAGVYNAVGGLAAVSNDDTLEAQATEVLFGVDLTVWGWFWLIVGVLQVVTGVLILRRHMWGLAMGVIGASLSVFLTTFVMFTFPLWAFAVLALDFLVLYGLLTRSDEF